MTIASQKPASRILLPYKSFHNTRDIFYDEMVLIFLMNTIVKRHLRLLNVITVIYFYDVTIYVFFFSPYCIILSKFSIISYNFLAAPLLYREVDAMQFNVTNI